MGASQHDVSHLGDEEGHGRGRNYASTRSWAPLVTFIHNWCARIKFPYHMSVSSPDREGVWLWFSAIYPLNNHYSNAM